MIKNLIRYLVLSIGSLVMMCDISAQENISSAPEVFLIGEYEEEYENIIASQNDLLLSVCDNSMDKAYSLWTGMLKDMEMLSEERNIDIKGVKIWLNVFWSKDGKIDHLVYYPKPHSRNMDFDLLTDFFEEFIDVYSVNVEAEKGFSHYGSASFPTFSSQLNAREK